MAEYASIISGLVNFRQLGGYPAAEGKTVRQNTFYRGAVLHNLTQEQERQVAALGIKTVFDLRSNFEVEQKPEQVPQGAVYHHHSGIASMDTGKQGNLDMQGLISGSASSPVGIEQLGSYLQNSYREMALNPKTFATGMQLLLDETATPIFFHCSAGKDRTGMFAACVLLVLGASRKTILQDYLLSAQYRKEETEREMAKLAAFTQDEALLGAIRNMLIVKEEYLNEVFHVIDTHYGGDAAFIETGLGLSAQQVQRLRAMYLVA